METFRLDDVVLLLGNSFIFYGVGYGLLDHHASGSQLLGAFTLGNVAVHLVVSVFIHRQHLADRNLYDLVTGLSLVFATIAIPVQLNGNWVTLLWVGEALLLFWIGRTRPASLYEKLAYPMMLLAFISLIHDWLVGYESYTPEKPETRLTPIFNLIFLTSSLFIAAFGAINRLNQNPSYSSPLAPGAHSFFSLLMKAILLLSLYFACYLEIEVYWGQLFTDSYVNVVDGQAASSYHQNHDLYRFKNLWLINYSLLFVSLLAWLNVNRVKDGPLGTINWGLIALGILLFLTQGLYELSELQASYLDQSLPQYHPTGIFHIAIRYVSLCFVVGALLAAYQYVQQAFMQRSFRVPFDFLLHASVLWIISSELVYWMDMSDSTKTYQLGLSILWGSYALFLIALGIWKQKKYLRVSAIILFGVTLGKLFIYDLASLDTVAKTIVLVSLGVLLLIISFLYNKYKGII
ncbi:MAG: DUF2339 domain-containing protein, partial [Bacteroidota bacterium]